MKYLGPARGALLVFCVLLALPARSLQPEDILGEYWKDPLFGVAAAQQTIQFEVLYKLLFSPNNNAHTAKKTRVVFENKTDEVHVFVLTKDMNALSEDEGFKSFVKDELHHASMATQATSGHHDHSSGSADGAKSIVRTLDENPTVTVAPDDFKEIIIRFNDPGEVRVLCVVEGHEELEHTNVISVNESVFDAMNLDDE
jgi:uncharacterized cupredoxin-like copper-binding protein